MIIFGNNVTFTDVIDILIVSFIIYRITLSLKPTKAYNVLRGLIIIIFVYFFASSLRLTTISWILQRTMELGALALIIVFQPELRLLLAKLGREGFSRSKIEYSNIDKIKKAVEYLSEKQIGAIIVFERRIGLGSIVEHGIQLGADISSELINSIFSPGNIMHDGAIIIQNNKIIAAGCFLPLAKNIELSIRYGSRHRAAAGITEETDAIVLVVSEETGLVSFVKSGYINAIKSFETLKNILIAELMPPQKKYSKLRVHIENFLKKIMEIRGAKNK